MVIVKLNCCWPLVGAYTDNRKTHVQGEEDVQRTIVTDVTILPLESKLSGIFSRCGTKGCGASARLRRPTADTACADTSARRRDVEIIITSDGCQYSLLKRGSESKGCDRRERDMLYTSEERRGTVRDCDRIVHQLLDSLGCLEQARVRSRS